MVWEERQHARLQFCRVDADQELLGGSAGLLCVPGAAAGIVGESVPDGRAGWDGAVYGVEGIFYSIDILGDR